MITIPITFNTVFFSSNIEGTKKKKEHFGITCCFIYIYVF